MFIETCSNVQLTISINEIIYAPSAQSTLSVPSRISDIPVYESCHIWMSHVSWHWVMSRMKESCHTALSTRSTSSVLWVGKRTYRALSVLLTRAWPTLNDSRWDYNTNSEVQLWGAGPPHEFWKYPSINESNMNYPCIYESNMNSPRHIYLRRVHGWVKYELSMYVELWRYLSMNESNMNYPCIISMHEQVKCELYYFMSQIWIRHVTYECVMFFRIRHVTYEWVTVRMNES